MVVVQVGLVGPLHPEGPVRCMTLYLGGMFAWRAPGALLFY